MRGNGCIPGGVHCLSRLEPDLDVGRPWQIFILSRGFSQDGHGNVRIVMGFLSIGSGPKSLLAGSKLEI